MQGILQKELNLTKLHQQLHSKSIVTAKEIAAALGASQATVSRRLSAYPEPFATLGKGPSRV